MKPKIAYIAAAALLILGAAVFVSRSAGERTPGSAAEAPRAARSTGHNATGGDGSPSSTPAASGPRAGRETKDAPAFTVLVEKYGESRTKLSAKIIADLAGIQEDGAEMSRMSSKGSGALRLLVPEMKLRNALGDAYDKLELTPEQKERIARVHADFEKRSLETLEVSLQKRKNNPYPMMELILAGDSFKRGKLSETEFNQIRDMAKEKDGSGQLTEDDSAGDVTLDPGFQASIEQILDPGQREIHAAALGEKQKPAEDKDPSKVLGYPVMELEQLDAKVTAARKVLAGVKGLVDVMGNLSEEDMKELGGMGADEH